MPLATDPDVFYGEPATTYARNLAFVGNSMLVQLGEALEKHVDLPHVTRAVERAIRERRATRSAYAEGVADIIGRDLYDSLDETGQRNAELLLNYEVTSHERIELARTLAPLGLEVRGDASWAKIIDKHGPGVHYFERLPH